MIRQQAHKIEDFKELQAEHGGLSGKDEQAWLMSLALDGALAPEEEERLNQWLASDASLGREWQTWQAVDGLLLRAEHVAPPPDFAARLDDQLVLVERRRRLRTAGIFALAAFGLWGSMVAGLVMALTFVWDNQVVWAGDMVQNVTYWLAVCSRLAMTLATGLQVLLTVPEAPLVLGGYIVTALVILLTWFVFLRRSLSAVPQVDSSTK